jgi:hypothetical protein
MARGRAMSVLWLGRRAPRNGGDDGDGGEKRKGLAWTIVSAGGRWFRWEWVADPEREVREWSAV